MFNGRNTNNGNGVNINTRLYTSYSDTCMISVGAWNDKISIKFHPMKGVNADGIRQYAQDNTEIVNTSLTVDNTITFITGITEKVEKALAEGLSESVAITTGIGENRKVIKVATDGKDVTITVYVGVSDNGVADEANSITHTFNKREYMIGYNPADGSGTTVSVNADFKNFVQKLKGIYDLAPVVPHAINYSNAIRNAYSSNRNSANMSNGGNSNYSAPINNFSGTDMTDFLPAS